MPDQLRDGTGSGYLAKVDSEHRLYTVNNNVSHLAHHATTHENAFFLNFETVLPDSNETPVLVFENDDATLDFDVYPVLVNSDADVSFHWYVDALYSSGGEKAEFINTNRGAGITITDNQANAYQGGAAGDLVLDTTSEKKFGSLHLAARMPFVYDFQGAIIIKANRSLAIKATGSAGDSVSASLMVAYHPEGTKL